MKSDKKHAYFKVVIPVLLIAILPLVGWFIYMVRREFYQPFVGVLTIWMFIVLVLIGIISYSIRKMRIQYQMLKSTNERLAEVDRLKTEFLANVSHELRTPLTVIMGYSELLLEKLEEEPDRARDFKYVQTIHRKSEDLLSLINDLIEFSRIESGRIEVHMKWISLVDVVRETAEELSTNASKKGPEQSLPQ